MTGILIIIQAPSLDLKPMKLPYNLRPSLGAFGALALVALQGGPLLAQAAPRGVAVSVPRNAHGRRVALVIGNESYGDMPLRNPVRDARALGQALREAHFQVSVRENLTQKQILRALVEFGDELRKGGVGLFYFSGHGIQINNRNYLLPVGATFERPDDIEIEGVDLSAVMRRMEGAQNLLNIVILDACRNNPFAKGLKRDLSRGLARMEAPSGVLVAYATEPGSTASDGTGDNGLYTKHLITSLRQPGVTLEQVFKRVREGVERESKGEQRPREDSALKGEDFFFYPPEAPVAPAAAPSVATVDPLAVEMSFWESVRGSALVEDLQAYLDVYPAGRFAVLARNRVRSLKAAAQAAPAAAPVVARVQPPEPRPEPPRPVAKPDSRPAVTATGKPAAVTTGMSLQAPPTALPSASLPAKPQPAGRTEPRPAVRVPATVATVPASRPEQTAPALPGPLVLNGHEDAIWAVAAASSGSFLASTGWDKTVRLWTAEGAQRHTYPAHTRYLECLAIAPDNRWVAAGTFQGVLVYDAQNLGAPGRFLQVGQDWVTSVAFSPDGKALAVGSKDRFLYVVEASSGAVRWKGNQDPTQEISSVAWDPGNRFVVGGNTGGAVQFFTPAGQRLYIHSPHANTVTALLFSSTDTSLMYSASRDGTVKAWNPERRREVWANVRFAGGMTALGQAGPGGPLLAAGLDRKIHLLDALSGKETRALEGHQGAVTAVAFNAANQKLVSGSDDRTVRLWPLNP
jgi:uncharacterized caspase-like protein